MLKSKKNIAQLILESSSTISLFNFDYFPDEDGKKVNAKNEDEDEKNWKNEFDFWNPYIKIRLFSNHGDFHENLRKRCCPIFKTFLTNQGKNEVGNENVSGNKFNLWIFHIKIRLYENCHENLRNKMKWKSSLTIWPFNFDYLLDEVERKSWFQQWR